MNFLSEKPYLHKCSKNAPPGHSWGNIIHKTNFPACAEPEQSLDCLMITERKIYRYGWVLISKYHCPPPPSRFRLRGHLPQSWESSSFLGFLLLKLNTSKIILCWFVAWNSIRSLKTLQIHPKYPIGKKEVGLKWLNFWPLTKIFKPFVFYCWYWRVTKISTD